MTIYDRIQIMCEIRGISVYALEKAIGIKNGTIKKWRNSTPYVSSIISVADYLDTSIDYLTGRTKNPMAVDSISNSTYAEALQKVLSLINKYNNFNNELEQLIEKYDIKALSNTPVLTVETGNEPESEEETK